jgi:hypothetical protein
MDIRGDSFHALVWNGTAGSVVDLNSFLGDLGVPILGSQASSISENGSITGHIYSTGAIYAVLWTPVPEPRPVALVVSGIAFATIVCARRLPLLNC